MRTPTASETETLRSEEAAKATARSRAIDYLVNFAEAATEAETAEQLAAIPNLDPHDLERYTRPDFQRAARLFLPDSTTVEMIRQLEAAPTLAKPNIAGRITDYRRSHGGNYADTAALIEISTAGRITPDTWEGLLYFAD